MTASKLGVQLVVTIQSQWYCRLETVGSIMQCQMRAIFQIFQTMHVLVHLKMLLLKADDSRASWAGSSCVSWPLA
jgi:hypothetical protein